MDPLNKMLTPMNFRGTAGRLAGGSKVYRGGLSNPHSGPTTLMALNKLNQKPRAPRQPNGASSPGLFNPGVIQAYLRRR